MKIKVTLDITNPEVTIKETYGFIEDCIATGRLKIEHVETIIKVLTELINSKKEEQESGKQEG